MSNRTKTLVAALAALSAGVPLFAISQANEVKPTYRTLALCLAAYDREHALEMEANARLTKAAALSGDEHKAIMEQGEHARQAGIIRQVCDDMKRNESSMADQVKELTGLLDGLGPTGGSVKTPVAGAVRQNNLTAAGDKMEQLGGTLDQALADFRASDFGSNSAGVRSSALVGKSDPALGAQAASAFRADVAQWNREEAAREAERQRLAAIEAERNRVAMAALAEQQRQREAERQASKKSGFWDTLGVIAGVSVGVAVGLKGGGNSQAAQAIQNMANAQALANAGRSSGGSSTGNSSCSLSSSDFSPEPPSTGNMCQDARAHVAWLERDASRARACGNTQLMQYYEDNLRDARSYAASVCL